MACPMCRKLLDDLERAQRELRTIREQHIKILNGPCPDEKHCTCVPALREGLEESERQFQAKVEELSTEIDKTRMFQGLFEARRAHDDKGILDDLDVAEPLLEKFCGEIGFALANNLRTWKTVARSVVEAGNLRTPYPTSHQKG